MIIIKPTHPLRNIWDGFILLLTIIAAMEIPYFMVFHKNQPEFLKYLEYTYFIVFTFDIFLNFHTGYFEGGKLILNPHQIRLNYLKTWFILDFVAAFPFEIFYYFNLGDILGIPLLNDRAFLRSLYIIRVVRLFRLIHYLKEWQRSQILNPAILRLISLFVWVGIIVHWVALAWIYIGRFDPNQSHLDNYILALYWAVTTMTTIGYGDIVPNTRNQYIFAILVEFGGVGLFGYIIGSITSLLANLDLSKTQFREKLEKLTVFMKSRHIPIELQQKIRLYYEYLWETKRGSPEQEILNVLPRSLKVEVAIALHSELLKKVPLFQNAELSLIRQLVLHLEPNIYLPGDIIFHQGEIGHGMYFIAKGKVEIYNELNQETYAILSDGNFFGELSLLYQTPRSATVKALDYSELYRLDKNVFDEIIKGFPYFAKEIQKKAKERKAHKKN